jgi:hypothetical protein
MVCYLVSINLSKKDWLDIGFKVLREFGQDKLKILYLCERLKVTRGSFYHHFDGIDNYIKSLMECWEKENTTHFIEKANKGQNAKKQKEILDNLSLQINPRIELAIRSWSHYNLIVKEHLIRVDNTRINYQKKLFCNLGYHKNKALLKARLEYATMVGIQQLFPDMEQSEVNKMFIEFSKGRNIKK